MTGQEAREPRWICKKGCIEPSGFCLAYHAPEGWEARDDEREVPVCREAYPNALRRGEVWECEKTGNHWKHRGHDHWVGADGEPQTGVIQWWGPKLTDEEHAEADRIRAIGGVDVAKRQQWLDQLTKEAQR